MRSHHTPQPPATTYSFSTTNSGVGGGGDKKGKASPLPKHPPDDLMPTPSFLSLCLTSFPPSAVALGKGGGGPLTPTVPPAQPLPVSVLSFSSQPNLCLHLFSVPSNSSIRLSSFSCSTTERPCGQSPHYPEPRWKLGPQTEGPLLHTQSSE